MKSYKFVGIIKGIYISGAGCIFCCVYGMLYRSSDNGKSFTEVIKLSTPQGFFFQDAITETPNGELFIGEYANLKEGKKFKFVGFVYHSQDDGITWKKIDFLQKAGVNKHIHVIKWSTVINGLILTDGDNQKNIWVNKSNGRFEKPATKPELGWKKLNRFHIQKGGYTGMVELKNKIVFGSDYYAGTNFLVTTKDLIKFDVKVVPDPYRRAMFDRIVLRRNKNNELELWSNLIFNHSQRVKSLVMMSSDEGGTWQKVYEYDGTQLEVRIMSNSRTINKEVYFTINDRNEKLATTMRIHS